MHSNVIDPGKVYLVVEFQVTYLWFSEYGYWRSDPAHEKRATLLSEEWRVTGGGQRVVF